MIKKVIGGILLLGGIGLGIYVGFWLMFIGGIVQIIDSIKNDTNAISIGIGFLRIAFSSLVGWGTALLSGTIGAALLSD